jgi:hypothetical protein
MATTTTAATMQRVSRAHARNLCEATLQLAHFWDMSKSTGDWFSDGTGTCVIPHDIPKAGPVGRAPAQHGETTLVGQHQHSL